MWLQSLLLSLLANSGEARPRPRMNAFATPAVTPIPYVAAVFGAAAAAPAHSQDAPGASAAHVRNATTAPVAEQVWEWRESARGAVEHAFDAYMTHGFPWDEVRPLGCLPRRWDARERGTLDDSLGGFGLTLLDSLDTLATVGDLPRFRCAISHAVQDVGFFNNVPVSVFETNIRVLGGLLSAHLLADDARLRLFDAPLFCGANTSMQACADAMCGRSCGVGLGCLGSYNGQLLSMATELATRLLPAFDTPSGIPYHRVNLATGVPDASSRETCTAAGGTFLVEFGLLSRLTGDGLFEAVARRAASALWGRRSPVTGLVGSSIDAVDGLWRAGHTGIGAGVDSYYEYLLKAGILLDDGALMKAWEQLSASVSHHTVFGDVHLEVGVTEGRKAPRPPVISSLQAFWPGLEVLSGRVTDARSHLKPLLSLWAKHRALPELYDVNAGGPVHFARDAPLRPELAESVYHVYTATRDPSLLRVAGTMLEALMTQSRVTCGFASIADVTTGRLDDRMDSYFIAETLKYLFLTFDSALWHWGDGAPLRIGSGGGSGGAGGGRINTSTTMAPAVADESLGALEPAALSDGADSAPASHTDDDSGGRRSQHEHLARTCVCAPSASAASAASALHADGTPTEQRANASLCTSSRCRRWSALSIQQRRDVTIDMEAAAASAAAAAGSGSSIGAAALLVVDEASMMLSIHSPYMSSVLKNGDLDESIGGRDSEAPLDITLSQQPPAPPTETTADAAARCHFYCLSSSMYPNAHPLAYQRADAEDFNDDDGAAVDNNALGTAEPSDDNRDGGSGDGSSGSTLLPSLPIREDTLVFTTEGHMISVTRAIQRGSYDYAEGLARRWNASLSRTPIEHAWTHAVGLPVGAQSYLRYIKLSDQASLQAAFRRLSSSGSSGSSSDSAGANSAGANSAGGKSAPADTCPVSSPPPSQPHQEMGHSASLPTPNPSGAATLEKDTEAGMCLVSNLRHAMRWVQGSGITTRRTSAADGSRFSTTDASEGSVPTSSTEMGRVRHLAGSRDLMPFHLTSAHFDASVAPAVKRALAAASVGTAATPMTPAALVAAAAAVTGGFGVLDPRQLAALQAQQRLLVEQRLMQQQQQQVQLQSAALTPEGAAAAVAAFVRALDASAASASVAAVQAQTDESTHGEPSPVPSSSSESGSCPALSIDDPLSALPVEKQQQQQMCATSSAPPPAPVGSPDYMSSVLMQGKMIAPPLLARVEVVLQREAEVLAVWREQQAQASQALQQLQQQPQVDNAATPPLAPPRSDDFPPGRGDSELLELNDFALGLMNSASALPQFTQLTTTLLLVKNTSRFMLQRHPGEGNEDDAGSAPLEGQEFDITSSAAAAAPPSGGDDLCEAAVDDVGSTDDAVYSYSDRSESYGGSSSDTLSAYAVEPSRMLSSRWSKRDFAPFDAVAFARALSAISYFSSVVEVVVIQCDPLQSACAVRTLLANDPPNIILHLHAEGTAASVAAAAVVSAAAAVMPAPSNEGTISEGAATAAAVPAAVDAPVSATSPVDNLDAPSYSHGAAMARRLLRSVVPHLAELRDGASNLHGSQASSAGGVLRDNGAGGAPPSHADPDVSSLSSTTAAPVKHAEDASAIDDAALVWGSTVGASTARAHHRTVHEDMTHRSSSSSSSDSSASDLFLLVHPAHFGSILTAVGLSHMRFRLANPLSACGPLTPQSDSDDDDGPFMLLVLRGECSFVTKARAAQAAGAAAVLVLDIDGPDFADSAASVVSDGGGSDDAVPPVDAASQGERAEGSSVGDVVEAHCVGDSDGTVTREKSESSSSSSSASDSPSPSISPTPTRSISAAARLPRGFVMSDDDTGSDIFIPAGLLAGVQARLLLQSLRLTMRNGEGSSTVFPEVGLPRVRRDAPHSIELRRGENVRGCLFIGCSGGCGCASAASSDHPCVAEEEATIGLVPHPNRVAGEVLPHLFGFPGRVAAAQQRLRLQAE